jgi:hypothetical protein
MGDAGVVQLAAIPTKVTTYLAVPRIVVAAVFRGPVRSADSIGLYALPRYARLR